MTVGEAAKIVLGDAAYDTALPQPWLDAAADALSGRFSYHAILSNFVWAYDEKAGLSGRPCALTHVGNEILDALNGFAGGSYLFTPNPAC